MIVFHFLHVADLFAPFSFRVANVMEPTLGGAPPHRHRGLLGAGVWLFRGLCFGMAGWSFSILFILLSVFTFTFIGLVLFVCSGSGRAVMLLSFRCVVECWGVWVPGWVPGQDLSPYLGHQGYGFQHCPWALSRYGGVSCLPVGCYLFFGHRSFLLVFLF